MSLGSGIRNKPIPDPGSKGQKGPNPGSGSATLVLFYVVDFMGCIPTPRVYFRVSSEGLSSGGNLLRLRTQDTPTRERREQCGGLGVIESGSAIRKMLDPDPYPDPH
jgi:hypothetical protein